MSTDPSNEPLPAHEDVEYRGLSFNHYVFPEDGSPLADESRAFAMQALKKLAASTQASGEISQVSFIALARELYPEILSHPFWMQQAGHRSAAEGSNPFEALAQIAFEAALGFITASQQLPEAVRQATSEMTEEAQADLLNYAIDFAVKNPDRDKARKKGSEALFEPRR